MSIIRNAQRAIEQSFNGPLKEFLKEVTFQYFESEGDYDAENDTRNPVYNPVITKMVPVVRPTIEEVTNLGIEMTTSKIIIPGQYLPRAMEVSDRVLVNGVEAPIRKQMGVPGDVIYILFVQIT